MTSKVQPAADHWTVDQENLGRDCVIFGEQKNKERNVETPLITSGGFRPWAKKGGGEHFLSVISSFLPKITEGPGSTTDNGEIFWMNNKAIIEFGFRRIWRILQISEGVSIHLGLWPLWMTPSLICRIRHILLSLIANCSFYNTSKQTDSDTFSLCSTCSSTIMVPLIICHTFDIIISFSYIFSFSEIIILLESEIYLHFLLSYLIHVEPLGICYCSFKSVSLRGVKR